VKERHYISQALVKTAFKEFHILWI